MSIDREVAAPSIEVGRTIAGFDPAELIAAYGRPLYVYDADGAASPGGSAASGAAGSDRDRLRLQGQQLSGGAGHAGRGRPRCRRGLGR